MLVQRTMKRLSRKAFERIVGEGIDAIPERFLRLLDNVVILIEDEPTREQLDELAIAEDETLFGLYEGVSQLERGGGYSGALPDRITIFKRPIEDEAEDEKEMREIVRDTVWHEIAHHFGMDESEVERAEDKRNDSS